MKIKKLVFKNINSLYGQWEIDFECEKFRQSGLFAITGKTGSGKSTILDAMTLALYGMTPRLKISTSEAVSRGSDECISELTFQDAQNRVWTARYSFDRYKKSTAKGAIKGAIKDKAAHKLSCDGVVVADKTTKVVKMVEEITGLDAKRFCRAVLLAQGSFDAFLNAGNENGSILERITGTEIYSRIAVKTKERHDEEKRKLEEIQIAFDGIRILPPEEVEQKQQELAQLTALVGELTAKQTSLNTLHGYFQQLDQNNAALEKCGEAEKQLAEEEKEFVPSRQRLIDGQKALKADSCYRPLKELQSAQDADTVALQKTTSLLKEQEELCAEISKKCDIADAANKAYQEEFAKLNTILAAVYALDNTVGMLNSSLNDSAEKRRSTVLQALETRREIRRTEQALEKLHQEHSQGIAYLNAHPADGKLEEVRKLCAERLASVKKLFAEIEEIRRNELALRKDIADISQKQTQKKKQFTAEEKKFSDLDGEKKKTETKLAELLDGSSKEHWLVLCRTQEQSWQRALQLRSLDDYRKHLQAGEACPLCGSKDHPLLLNEIPEPENEQQELEKTKKRLADIDAAEQLLQKISASAEICANNKKQLAETLEQLQNQLTEKEKQIELNCTQKQNSMQEESEQIIKKTEDELAPYNLVLNKEDYSLPQELSDRIKEYAKYKSEQEVFENRQGSLQNDLLRLRTVFESQFRSCAASRKELFSVKSQLLLEKQKRFDLFGSKDSAAEAQKAEKKRNALAADLEKVRQSLAGASANCERTRKDIQTLEKNIAQRSEEILNSRAAFLLACEQSGITEEMFYSCVLDPETMAALTARDTELKTRKVQLAENRKNCETAIAALKKQLEKQQDREALVQELSEISDTIQEKSQYIGAVREILKKDADDKLRLAEQHKKLLAQQKVMELWRAMYELIGSKDKFQRFAQSITLEHLLALANIELAKLSDRYRLLRSKQEDLAIDVADKEQGDEIRRCQTLSGGERFLVSLSLALGLSQMAGEKIQVDSLFLDEGFGTLDSDTLNVALEALNSLRNRGKLVGVISHVTALSEKIPCTIEVIPQGGGRSILRGDGVSAH